MSNGTITTEPTALAVPECEMGLTSRGGFELIQRVATCLCASTLVPKEYQGKHNLPNVVIALEMAYRIGITPLAVMQNLYIVHGKPSWSSAFIIASINSCRRFNPLRFDMQGSPGKDDRTCIAWTTEVAFPLPRGTQTLALARDAGLPILEASPVSIDMAKKEGWWGKNGSKWPTMPEQMLRYRAATFWGRLYAPDLLMGIRPQDELDDIAAAAVGNIPSRIAARSDPVDVPEDTEPASVSRTDQTAADLAQRAAQAQQQQPPAQQPTHADIVANRLQSFVERVTDALGCAFTRSDSGSWYAQHGTLKLRISDHPHNPANGAVDVDWVLDRLDRPLPTTEEILATVGAKHVAAPVEPDIADRAARDDMYRELHDRIAEAADTMTISEIDGELRTHRAWLGEEAFARLQAMRDEQVRRVFPQQPKPSGKRK